jgi:hypothetical protein
MSAPMLALCCVRSRRLLGEDRFAEQLEAMAGYGKLRPSDAKKQPELQVGPPVAAAGRGWRGQADGVCAQLRARHHAPHPCAGHGHQLPRA